MPQARFEGFYGTFTTPDKTVASRILGADVPIGSILHFDFQRDPEKIWVFDRYNHALGTLDADSDLKVRLMHAHNQEIQAVLAAVFFTENENEGTFWAEILIMGYSVSYHKTFNRFVERISGLCIEGIRPDIDLGEQGIAKLLEDNDWLPTKRIAPRTLSSDTVRVKSKQSFQEKMVEQARAGNKGCFFAGWAFLLALVALVVWLIWWIPTHML